MKKITEKDFDKTNFKGVIIGIPKNPELDWEFSINFECAYYSRGLHGYPESGRNPDNSSFFTIFYDAKEYLPNGFFYNSTSRLPWEKKYHYLNNVDYYKFDSMTEFCEWYLKRKQKHESKDLLTNLQQDPGYLKPFTAETYKPKRKDRLKEVQQYVQKVMNIEHFVRLAENAEDVKSMKKFENNVLELQQELLDWLEEEI